jgi:hypothetical protein
MKLTVICLFVLSALLAGTSYANLEISAATPAQASAGSLPSFIQVGKKYECDAVTFTVYAIEDNGWVKVISVTPTPEGPNTVLGVWVNIANYQLCRQKL